MPSVFGVIGGSGLYAMEGLEGAHWIEVDSPFGAPSDAFLKGSIAGQTVVFLPRHGRGHRISPSDINYRANIDAMKRLGVTEILSVSAVGSLKEEIKPGTLVVVDQFIDRTRQRARSFFGTGFVAHVAFADPVCGRLGTRLGEAMEALSLPYRMGGNYLCIEGPQFSTKAEAELHRSWGCDLVGMTNLPEARLAREAEICYATLAMVTDYDCWLEGHDSVTVAQIVAVLNANAEMARSVVKNMAPRLSGRAAPCELGCHMALEHAVITAPEARNPELVMKLDAVAGRVLEKSKSPGA